MNYLANPLGAFGGPINNFSLTTPSTFVSCVACGPIGFAEAAFVNPAPGGTVELIGAINFTLNPGDTISLPGSSADRRRQQRGYRRGVITGARDGVPARGGAAWSRCHQEEEKSLRFADVCGSEGGKYSRPLFSRRFPHAFREGSGIPLAGYNGVLPEFIQTICQFESPHCAFLHSSRQVFPSVRTSSRPERARSKSSKPAKSNRE